MTHVRGKVRLNKMEDNSILNSIKKLLGLSLDYNPFDADIILHINTVFANLAQMGVNPSGNENGFSISDSSTTWSEFTNDNNLLNNVKSYVYLKVRMIFDPPTVGSITESFNNQIRELEYRLYTQEGGY